MLDHDECARTAAEPNDGGPAFPQHGWTKDPETLRRMQEKMGLSVRDYFAAAALQTLVGGFADCDTKHADGTANAAYTFADAMIARRDTLNQK